jgi:hypothetical protein
MQVKPLVVIEGYQKQSVVHEKDPIGISLDALMLHTLTTSCSLNP